MAGGTCGLFPSLAEQKRKIMAKRKATALIAESKITYEQRVDVYNTAIERYGVPAQSWMVIEEMSELAKELCKMQRGQGDVDALADEIADVTIMLEQLRLMYDVNTLVCKHMDMKVNRLCSRLGMPEVST